VILVETYAMGTVVGIWIQELFEALVDGNILWAIENDTRILRYWYSTSATYIFSVWFIKMGIAWFLCRLSNNIFQYGQGRLRNVLFYYIVASFGCVLVVFWASCLPNDFIRETTAGTFPPVYHRCKWDVQVIAPTVFNVIADVILFLYPFPIIFMANIPQSLRISLLFIFGLCGLVTASAIVRVTLMTAGKFLQSEEDIFAYSPIVITANSSLSWWAALECSLSLLVASLPVLGGRLISRWRHILTRSTKGQSINLSKVARTKQSNNTHNTQNTTQHSVHDGFSQKTIETVVSAGSTFAESPGVQEEEPVSLIQHMVRMGRRSSNHDAEVNPNQVTIKKEVYIREETKDDSPV